jgi:hypothetical protein
MIRNRFLVLSAMAGLVLISACNLPISPADVSQPSQDTSTTILTQAAAMGASTESAQTSLANAAAATMQSMVTDTPEFTFTPSLTPSLTVTLTPSVPMVSVSQETNCRSGPGDPYAILGTLPVGVQAEVVGRSDYDDWIIKLPSKPSVTCWLWDYYATVTGDTTTLPKVTPVPSPTPTATATTPAASFILEYLTYHCGSSYTFMFKITNNGNTTWESNRVQVTNNDTHISDHFDNDLFPNADETTCSMISIDENLEPGEVGYTNSSCLLATDPTGHSFTVTIRLCSQNGLAGTCLDKTINLTP